MNVQAVSAPVANTKGTQSVEQVERNREKLAEGSETLSGSSASSKVQPEELIGQIKAITENGTYSVQFESNDEAELIVKVVDRDTNEVIRQIPPEELLELTKHLKELTGNIVDTVG